jgi:AraC-like DNA-binding protein
MKKNYFHKGKTFYAILRLLVISINVPILIALLFTQRTLDLSNETLQSMLGTAQETQMKYIQEANPGRNHTAQLSALREHAVLKELGEANHLEYGKDIEEAEKILLSVSPAHSDYGHITTYLYFTKSNYLIDSSRLGGNASGTVDPRIFSGFDGLDSSYTGVPRAFWDSANSQSNEERTIYTAIVFPDVIFIFDIHFTEYPVSNRPDMSLSKDFTGSLKDVEMCYYDSYGNVRATSGARELIYQYDYYTLGPDRNNYFSFRYNGRFYLCHYVFNEYNMTKFALFYRDEIAEEQQKTTVLIWVSGGILLIGFLACAIIYTQRTYKPIGSLITRLNKNASDDLPRSRDEFKVLNEAIDSFDNRLSKRDHLLSRYYLLRILRGQKVDALEDYQDDWFSDESGYSFAVAALHVDEFEGSDLYDESLLENTVASFFRSENLDIRTVSDNDFLYIVFRLLREVQNADLIKVFQRLQQQLGNYYISVYISDIHTFAREIRRCYNEAMAVSEYYIANGKISIIANSASTPQTSLMRGTSSPDFGQLRKLSDCITTLSVEDALCVFDDLTYQLVKADGKPLTAESTLYNLLVDTIALAVYDIDMPGDVGKSVIQQFINLIRSASGVGQLRLQLQECLQTLNKRSDGHEYYLQRFEKIRDYIKEHYPDPNLDSASIADYYKMSPSTITRLFKKYNDSGFLEYVHQTRVQKAIELLQNTDLPISEISTLVGYTNAATMNRAFKAHAKSTPSMIRKRSARHLA